MQIIRRNFGYKLISVIIAVLLYVIADKQLNPRTMNDVYVVPEVADVPNEMVVRSAPAGFTVSVSGLTSSVAAFKAELKATVDLTHAHLGTQKLPIHYKLPSGDIDTSTWPVNAEVTLEQKASHIWDVDVPYDADPPPGYIYTDPVATPKEVVVTGLSADIHRVARVIAVVPKTEAAGSIDQNVDLVAQDKQWQNVDTVEIQPSRVQVHIGLKLAETTKSVLLSADVKGKPAPGFAVTNYTFRPVALTVVGTEDVLRAVSGLTVPVNVDASMKHPVTLTVHPVLPTGATLQNPTDATVRIDIEIKPIAPSATLSPTPGVPGAASPAPVATATPAPLPAKVEMQPALKP